MSSCTATVSLGQTGMASGGLKTIDVVGHLFVGGSGTWHFNRLQGAMRSETGDSMTLESRGQEHLWSEVAIGFALCMGDDLPLDTEQLVDPRADSIRDDPDRLRSLVSAVGRVGVAAVLTLLESTVPVAAHDLSLLPGWSVEVAISGFRRRHSRWGTEETRDDIRR